ncbi:glycosyltransferase family 87 protein [Corynebacterium gerontici]|uniref:Alpha-(1->3)-arabinofuranosyltransferase n=1 Tax=Corynebacterium gerontici TaxID=2079234 RepID=A0A3G6J6C0_9CORY|nr:glycosyltransferase family 87 protein [Corynebacterium gerontici]AZA11564.1 Alpha-(1->3)-arabinofuranosyltransferase [Corynebacterium gerontici]
MNKPVTQRSSLLQPHRFPAARPLRPAWQWDARANMALWPIAIMVVLHKIFVFGANGATTDDYSTVYNALRRAITGVPIYSENYDSVVPHYLYNPGATLLLMPLAWTDNLSAARLLFIILNGVCIVLGLWLLARLFGFGNRSCVIPASIALAFMTESVGNTLAFSNINGMLFFALVSYLWAVLRNKKVAAGVILGFMILIKPVFAPLLFIPLVLVWWQPFVAVAAVVIGFNLPAWFILPGTNEYLTRTVPYLRIVRDYSNSSLRGMGVYFDTPSWIIVPLWLGFAVLALFGLAALLRWRNSDGLLWLCTTSSLLLVSAFFLSSLGQMYYSMMLFPLLFTVFLPRSAMHNPLAWLAVYLFLSPSEWYSMFWDWLNVSRFFELFRATYGWGMLIIVISVSALVWALPQAKHQHAEISTNDLEKRA